MALLLNIPTDGHELPRPIDAPSASNRAYSPGQVACAAFIGGPLAGSLLLASNFRLFGSRFADGQTILLGTVASFAVIALALIVPEDTPNALIPAIQAGAARVSNGMSNWPLVASWHPQRCSRGLGGAACRSRAPIPWAATTREHWRRDSDVHAPA